MEEIFFLIGGLSVICIMNCFQINKINAFIKSNKKETKDNES
jgi:hypothetical protein